MTPGIPIVVSAPSGGGKTSLCHQVAKVVTQTAFSISHTTRAQYAGEQNGRDYHFVTPAHFKAMIQANAFLEYAQVHEHYYGTSREALYRYLNTGIDVLLDIDVQGGKQIIEKIPSALLIFLLPPSLHSLRQRLVLRQRDDANELTRRISKAEAEIRQAVMYRYVLINDVFETTAEQLCRIIQVSRIERTDKNALINHVLT